MTEYSYRPTTVEIDLRALRHNAATLCADLPAGCSMMAVVKADAYGHGAVAVARTLYREGIRHFAVATAEEGIALRRAGLQGEILILGYTDPSAARALYAWRLTQTVISPAHAAALDAAGHPLSVHLKIDSGMHRVGIEATDAQTIRDTVAGLSHLRVRGMFTHLCVADDPTQAGVAFTRTQLACFEEAIATLRSCCPDTELALHARNSAGICYHPPRPWETLVRSGIGLYGLDAAAQHHPTLRPVLSFRSRIILLRRIGPGETVGYGRTWRAARESLIATVPVGYADGLPRLWGSRGGEVLIRGVRCPIAGRICMDQLTVDVTDLPAVAEGDEVTLIGSNGRERITADEIAQRCDTISYELLSRMGARPTRSYREG